MTRSTNLHWCVFFSAHTELLTWHHLSSRVRDPSRTYLTQDYAMSDLVQEKIMDAEMDDHKLGDEFLTRFAIDQLEVEKALARRRDEL